MQMRARCRYMHDVTHASMDAGHTVSHRYSIVQAILLSEVSLPGAEALIEKFLPKIGDWGRRTPLNGDASALRRRQFHAKLPLYGASALRRRQFQYDFCTLCTTSQAQISVCMQGSCECCPSFYGSLVRHQVLRDGA